MLSNFNNWYQKVSMWWMENFLGYESLAVIGILKSGKTTFCSGIKALVSKDTKWNINEIEYVQTQSPNKEKINDCKISKVIDLAGHISFRSSWRTQEDFKKVDILLYIYSLPDIKNRTEDENRFKIYNWQRIKKDLEYITKNKETCFNPKKIFILGSQCDRISKEQQEEYKKFLSDKNVFPTSTTEMKFIYGSLDNYQNMEKVFNEIKKDLRRR